MRLRPPAWPAGRRGGWPERAAVATEAAVVFPLVVMTAVGLLQFAIYRHASNVVVGAVQDGVEVAARADYTVPDGVARTQALLQAGLGQTAAGITVQGSDGGNEVAIQADGRLPLVIPWAGSASLPLSFRAVESKERFRVGPSS
ncbi:MAG TPA: TadE/TadG family type IV pilus assembly protein [Chloroflexota bacterium]|nr:TadE/TadG family type IV pilus assembly protein [Chloroflexota bacterium]